MKDNSKLNFLQQAARASWILPIAATILMAVSNPALINSNSPITGVIMSAVFLILLLSGVVFGIIGCFGVKRYGAKTTIIPGIIGATLSASILAILLSIAVPTFLQYRETSRENTINALQKLTDQANEKLPVMIDPDTRFDRIDVIAPDLLKYKFTFVNNELSEFDAEQFLLEARPQLIEHYRTSDQFKMHRENGISVQFSYYSKNGEFLTNIPISADSISNKTATSDR